VTVVVETNLHFVRIKLLMKRLC